MARVTAPDGLRIGYEEAGKGPALVLLPGSLGDRKQWGDAGYVAAFRSIARVISVDGLGRGESDAPHEPEAYGIERHARDVVALLDELGVERATIWGHSMGGRVGVELAARHPERVVALIATGASGHAFSPFSRFLADSADHIVRGGLSRAAELYAGALDVPEWMVANWSEGDAEAIAASMRANAEWTGADDRMATLECPVLLIVGERDPVLERAHDTAARVPRCVLAELEGADHVTSFVPSDVPCAIALEWLRDLWVPEAVSPAGDNPGDK